MPPSEGRVRLEIKYCVSWGYFWQAASLAAELADGEVRKTSIALTPVAEGRFEVYLDGVKVYDRKELKEEDFVPTLKVLRNKVGLALKDLHEAAEAASEAAVVAS